MAIKFKLSDPKRAEKYFSDKLEFTIGPMELNYLRKERANVNIIDVRASEDYVESHIPGASNLPQDKWNSFEGLKKDQTNILYCYSQTCHLAAQAAKKFAAKGFPVVELEGGFEDWKEHDLEIEKEKTESQFSKTTSRQRSEADQAPLE